MKSAHIVERVATTAILRPRQSPREFRALAIARTVAKTLTRAVLFSDCSASGCGYSYLAARMDR